MAVQREKFKTELHDQQMAFDLKLQTLECQQENARRGATHAESGLLGWSKLDPLLRDEKIEHRGPLIGSENLGAPTEELNRKEKFFLSWEEALREKEKECLQRHESTLLD